MTKYTYIFCHKNVRFFLFDSSDVDVLPLRLRAFNALDGCQFDPRAQSSHCGPPPAGVFHCPSGRLFSAYLHKAISLKKSLVAKDA